MVTVVSKLLIMVIHNDHIGITKNNIEELSSWLASWYHWCHCLMANFMVILSSHHPMFQGTVPVWDCIFLDNHGVLTDGVLFSLAPFQQQLLTSAVSRLRKGLNCGVFGKAHVEFDESFQILRIQEFDHVVKVMPHAKLSEPGALFQQQSKKGSLAVHGLCIKHHVHTCTGIHW